MSAAAGRRNGERTGPEAIDVPQGRRSFSLLLELHSANFVQGDVTKGVLRGLHY
jgi:hypothetical protein